MESMAKIICQVVRECIPRIQHIAEFVGEPFVYPAFEIENISVTALEKNSLGKSQRYINEALVDSKLSFLDDPEEYDLKYEIRNETYKLLRSYLGEFPVFLNLDLTTVGFKSVNRVAKVEEKGFIKTVYNIQYGYKLLENWERGLSIPEIFSSIDDIQAPINKI